MKFGPKVRAKCARVRCERVFGKFGRFGAEIGGEKCDRISNSFFSPCFYVWERATQEKSCATEMRQRAECVFCVPFSPVCIGVLDIFVAVCGRAVVLHQNRAHLGSLAFSHDSVVGLPSERARGGRLWTVGGWTTNGMNGTKRAKIDNKRRGRGAGLSPAQC